MKYLEDVVKMLFVMYYAESLCPENTEKPIKIYNGLCYEFVDSRLTRLLAGEYCEQHNGKLVAIMDADTQNFIVDTLTNELHWDFFDNIYIDAYLIESVWRYENGEEITYTDWGFGQNVCSYWSWTCPEECVVLNMDSNDWADTSCISWNYFICQYVMKVEWNECPTEGYFIGFRDNCYEFVNSKVDQDQAHFYCLGRGGMLAEIRDIYISKVLNEAITNFKFDWNYAYFGAWKMHMSTGPWMWANGDVVTFNLWPDGKYTCEMYCPWSCAVLTIGSGQWNHANCAAYHPFICEYSIKVNYRDSPTNPSFPSNVTNVTIATDALELSLQTNTNNTIRTSSPMVTIDGILFVLLMAIVGLSATSYIIFVLVRNKCLDKRNDIHIKSDIKKLGGMEFSDKTRSTFSYNNVPPSDYCHLLSKLKIKSKVQANSVKEKAKGLPRGFSKTVLSSIRIERIKKN